MDAGYCSVSTSVTIINLINTFVTHRRPDTFGTKLYTVPYLNATMSLEKLYLSMIAEAYPFVLSSSSFSSISSLIAS